MNKITKKLKVGLSDSDRTELNESAVSEAKSEAEEYLAEAAQTIVITDKKESNAYGWRFQISEDGQPQLVVITD